MTFRLPVDTTLPNEHEARRNYLRQLSRLLFESRLKELPGDSSNVRSEIGTSFDSEKNATSEVDNAMIVEDSAEKRLLSQGFDLSSASSAQKRHKPLYRDVDLQIQDTQVLPETEAAKSDFSDSFYDGPQESPFEESRVDWVEQPRSRVFSEVPSLEDGSTSVIAPFPRELSRRSSQSGSDSSNTFDALQQDASSHQTIMPLETSLIKNLLKPYMSEESIYLSRDSWSALGQLSGQFLKNVCEALKAASKEGDKKLSRDALITVFRDHGLVSQFSDNDEIFALCAEYLCTEDLNVLEMDLFK